MPASSWPITCIGRFCRQFWRPWRPAACCFTKPSHAETSASDGPVHRTTCSSAASFSRWFGAGFRCSPTKTWWCRNRGLQRFNASPRAVSNSAGQVSDSGATSARLRQSEGPRMLQRRDSGPGARNLCAVDVGPDDPWLFAGFGENVTPRRDHQCMAVCLPAAFVAAALRRRQNETAGFDRPCPQKNVPVGLA